MPLGSGADGLGAGEPVAIGGVKPGAPAFAEGTVIGGTVLLASGAAGVVADGAWVGPVAAEGDMPAFGAEGGRGVLAICFW